MMTKAPGSGPGLAIINRMMTKVITEPSPKPVPRRVSTLRAPGGVKDREVLDIGEIFGFLRIPGHGPSDDD